MAIYWTLGNFLKPLDSINLPKSPTVLGNFCVGVKIFNFSSEIIFGQLLWTFGKFFSGHTGQHAHRLLHFDPILLSLHVVGVEMLFEKNENKQKEAGVWVILEIMKG